MKSAVSYRRVWEIAYPIMIGSVAQNVINVTDTAFLGRLGEVALGAGAIGGLFYLAIIMLGWGVGIGAQIIVARRHGEGKSQQIGSTIDHAEYFLLLLALLLILFYQLFGHSLLSYMVKSDKVLAASISFLDYRIWGLFFAFTYFSLRGFYVGIGLTKVITYTTITMVVVNVILAYSLIFGHLGFTAMGIKGAGLASVIAEFSGMIAVIFYSSYYKYRSRYNLFRFRNFNMDRMFKLLDVSVPLMLQNFFSFSIWFLFFLIIEKMGEVQLAVSNIVRSIYVVLLIPIMGFATSANTLVSYEIGQGKSGEVVSLTWRIAILSAGLSSILSVLCILLPDTILSVYTNDALLIKLSNPILHIVTIASVILSIAFVLFNGVSGTGKTRVSLFIELAILMVYILLTWYIALWAKWDLSYVWSVEIVYGVLLSLSSFIYLKSYRWVGKKV